MAAWINRLKENRSTLIALGEAFLAMLIWSSTSVGVKMGLAYMKPLTIAALRYFIGFLILFTYLIRKTNARASLRALSAGMWLRLAVIGVCAYTIGNGMSYLGLQYLPASVVGFMETLTPVLVLIGGIIFLKEIPSRVQMLGIAIGIAGSVLFPLFGGFERGGAWIGFMFVGFSLFGFACFNILSRLTARSNQADTVTLTAIPLGFGGTVLVALALTLEGLPTFSWQIILILLWLTLLNTIAGYLLFNHAFRSLMAVEMNAVMTLSPLSTAFLAGLLLGERLNPVQYLAMGVVIVGVFLVQRRRPGKTGAQGR